MFSFFLKKVQNVLSESEMILSITILFFQLPVTISVISALVNIQCNNYIPVVYQKSASHMKIQGNCILAYLSTTRTIQFNFDKYCS